MTSYLDRVQVLVTSTGTADLELGTAYAANVFDMIQAGAVDGMPYSYVLSEGNNSEVGRGIWNAATSRLTRNVFRSLVSGTPGTGKISLTGNGVCVIDVTATDLANMVSTDAMSLGAAAQNQVQKNIGLPSILRSYLAGLTLSTAGSSTSFGIAIGVATNSTNVDMMSLTSAYTKTTSAWAVGTAVGALDTGTIANSTWYHVHLIKRLDSGVVDVLVSLSATAPTLPTNYTLSRRIGSMKTNGSGQWVKFYQSGDEFILDTPVQDINGLATSTTSALRTLPSIPSNAEVTAKFNLNLFASGGAQLTTLITSPLAATQTSNSPPGNYSIIAPSGNSFGQVMSAFTASQQVRIVSDGPGQLYLNVIGWLDRRGRDS